MRSKAGVVHKEKTALVHFGLQTLIERESSKCLAKLGGTEKISNLFLGEDPLDAHYGACGCINLG